MDTEFLSSLIFILSGVHKVESQMTVLTVPSCHGPQFTIDCVAMDSEENSDSSSLIFSLFFYLVLHTYK